MGTSPASSSGDRDDRHVGDRRMRQQHRLQLRRSDLAGLVLDQLLQAVDQEEVAVLVRVADVAGVQPAVGVDHRGGGVRPVEVALHHLRPANPELAMLAGPEIGPGREVDDPALGVGDKRPNRTRFDHAAAHRCEVGRRGWSRSDHSLAELCTRAVPGTAGRGPLRGAPRRNRCRQGWRDRTRRRSDR